MLIYQLLGTHPICSTVGPFTYRVGCFSHPITMPTKGINMELISFHSKFLQFQKDLDASFRQNVIIPSMGKKERRAVFGNLNMRS